MPFSPRTLDFLWENRMRNSRDWFEEHKSEYRSYVMEPLCELVEALTPTMLQIDTLFTIDPKVDKTISRIWRDTRYSHDKSLYRDTMWIIFKRGKMHGTEVPGFYFEISCDGFNYGCGFYHASTNFMDTMRRQILEAHPVFQKALSAFTAQTTFSIEGDCYKRPHFPDAAPELQNWLERRNICFIAESGEADLLFSHKLADVLAADFLKLRSIYDFLLHVSTSAN